MADNWVGSGRLSDIRCLQEHAAKIDTYLERKPRKGATEITNRFVAFAKWAREAEHCAERRGKPREVLKLPIEAADLAQYARKLHGDGKAMSTINSYISALGAMHIAAEVLIRRPLRRSGMYWQS